MISTRSESFALGLEKKNALFPSLVMSQHHGSEKNEFVKQERQGMMGAETKAGCTEEREELEMPGRKHGH